MTTSSSVTAHIVDLSAQLAAKLLTSNTGNRRIRIQHVNELAQAMRRGEWQFNGAAVRVSRTGRLIDGQHRCAAVVKSGVTVQALLVTGLDDNFVATIDCGLRRTAADALAIRGETRCALLAAMLGVMHDVADSGAPINKTSPTVPQLLQSLDQHPGLRRSAKWVTSTRWCQRHLKPSLAGVLHYLFSCHDAAAAERFFQGLESGVGLAADSPVLHLRNRLLLDKLPASKSAVLMFKAFRLHLGGVAVNSLSVRGGEKDAFTL